VQEIAIFRAKEWIAFADAHCSLTNLHNKRVDGIKKKREKKVHHRRQRAAPRSDTAQLQFFFFLFLFFSYRLKYEK